MYVQELDGMQISGSIEIALSWFVIANNSNFQDAKNAKIKHFEKILTDSGSMR